MQMTNCKNLGLASKLNQELRSQNSHWFRNKSVSTDMMGALLEF